MADQEMVLDLNGIHALLDMLIGTVECPYEGWRTKDLMSVSLFVFGQAPKLKLTAEGIAADYALQRDSSCGL